MNNTNCETENFQRYYLSEFELFDGDHFITFNIVELDDNKKITVAISNQGKISVVTYDLLNDNGRCYFEYELNDIMSEEIDVDDFEQVEEE